MSATYEVITAHIAKWETHYVEPVVFGTTKPHEIAHLIDTFCQQELGSAVARFLFYETSIGVASGVQLTDERRVVVKVHKPSTSLAFLQAMVQVQHYLLAHDYPCTRPLLEPRPFAFGHATTEELVDEGEYHEAHDPAIRRSMAEMLALLIKLTREPATIPGLQPSALDLRLAPGVIWGTPHNAMFDFVATTKGAEWIDEIAYGAQNQKLQGAGELVI